MGESIALWSVTNGVLERVASRQVDRERRLEDWIESHPDILGERLLIVGRQVKTRYGGLIDLLAIDSEGRCVVIELKRGRTPRDIVAQALDYVSWVAELSDAEVRDRVAIAAKQSFNDAYRARFGLSHAPEQVNTDQRILIVATDVDEATSRIVEYLTQRYGTDINVVALSYFDVGGQELLARTWTVNPVELQERVDARLTDPGPDTESTWTGLWHVNVGAHADDAVGRNWEDERYYSFLSAGQGPKWRDEMLKLSVGDKVYAYLNGSGYVGAGVVVSTAVKANDFNPPVYHKLAEVADHRGWFLNGDDPDMAEYMVGVQWSKTVDASSGVRVPHPLRGTVRKIRSADLAQTLTAAFGYL